MPQLDPSDAGRNRQSRTWRERLRTVRDILGIDRAIFYTIVARGWSALAGPVSLVFVARFLSPEEQGFYYTFASVLALQVFFELGLAYVIMQSASHEKARLHWTADDACVGGDAGAKSRLASLFKLALKWYTGIAILAGIVLATVGFWFFRSYQPPGVRIAWEIPWIGVVLFTSLNIFLAPFIGVVEGCGKVAEIASLHVRQAVTGSLAVWVGLGLGLKLYAAPLVSLASVGAALIWLWGPRRGFFLDLLKTPILSGGAVKWRKEIFPFQWKIALSWLSSYFIFHLANPVLFRYHGAAEAGRMGMTMRIIDSITALGFAWVSTKSAPFGSYIARRDFGTLDAVFRKALLQSVVVSAAGGATFVAAYHILQQLDSPYVDRLIEPLGIYFLAASAVLNCVIFGQATYLRAHKAEPFLINSAIGAVVTPLIMFYVGRPHGAVGIAIAALLANLIVGLPLASAVFYKKRREWHGGTTET